MALQGTIDAFPLIDVVQLLGASRKTGHLGVDGDRGPGDVWVEDGTLVAAVLDGAVVTDPVLAVFELLRCEHGSFLFDPGAAPEVDRLEGAPLLDLLDRAAGLLEEWAAVRDVVPSTAHRALPVADPGVDTVTLDAADWRLVVHAGRCGTVGELGEVLGLDELGVGRALVRLVAAGLVEVAEPAPADGPALPDGGAVRGAATPDPVAVRPVDDVGAVDAPADLPDEPADPEPFPEHFPIDDLLGSGEAEDPWAALAAEDDRFAAAQPFADPEAPVVLPPVGDAGWGEAFHPADVPGPVAAQPFTDPPAFTGDAFTGDAFTEVAFGEPEGDAPAGSEDAPEAGDGPDGTDEILRQMARLSPKAAEAIAAALGSGAEGDDGPAEGAVDGFLGGR